ncbi:MAG: hypothetical protein QOE92_2425 [Chloroflexota bacterium]|nr:hypothetical protein [Chloroflexota bacterium]
MSPNRRVDRGSAAIASGSDTTPAPKGRTFRTIAALAVGLVALGLVGYLMSIPECELSPCQRGELGPQAICTMVCRTSLLFPMRIPLAVLVTVIAILAGALLVHRRDRGSSNGSAPSVPA